MATANYSRRKKCDIPTAMSAFLYGVEARYSKYCCHNVLGNFVVTVPGILFHVGYLDRQRLRTMVADL